MDDDATVVFTVIISGAIVACMFFGVLWFSSEEATTQTITTKIISKEYGAYCTIYTDYGVFDITENQYYTLNVGKHYILEIRVSGLYPRSVKRVLYSL